MTGLGLLARLLAVALPPYFAWEMLQMLFFTGMPVNWVISTLLCGLAALGNGVIILGLYAFGAWAFRSREWFSPPRWRRYAIIVLAAIVVNVAAEWASVGGLRLWGYRSWHPVVAGVGLVAVLQALVMPPLTFAFLAAWSDHRRKAEAARRSEARRDGRGGAEHPGAWGCPGGGDDPPG